MLKCNCGHWIEGLDGAKNVPCPRCGAILSPAPADTRESALPRMTAWGLLHSYAPTNATKWNPATARQWYDTEWTQLIPSCGECRVHWAELTDKYPPDFSSPEAFFEWGYWRHDDVSRLHSKRPRITLEEAYAIYWPR